jgi:hypothetical protein
MNIWTVANGLLMYVAILTAAVYLLSKSTGHKGARLAFYLSAAGQTLVTLIVVYMSFTMEISLFYFAIACAAFTGGACEVIRDEGVNTWAILFMVAGVVFSYITLTI